MENYRGKDGKQKICNDYSIKPISFIKLLKGQSKEGCCGLLTDRYYTFAYAKKGEEKNLFEYFFVGHHCANEFLEILGLNPLPFFNPLKQTKQGDGKNDGMSTSAKSNNHPLNEELIAAINLLCISWNTIARSRLAYILDFTRSSNSTPNQNGVIWFNDIVSTDKRKRTLRQMILELSKDNDLRAFDFKEMNSFINSKSTPNWIQ